MDKATRDQLIARYREGPSLLAVTVAAQPPDALDRRPPDGSWSARMIVHHVADSEMTSAIRLRRLIAEDNPVITGYDEELFARELFYDRPIEASLAAIRAARETSAEILLRLGEDQWKRAGTHSESGPYSVDTWLEIYADHCHDHALQAQQAMNS